MQKDPKIVIESVLDNNGTRTEKNIKILKKWNK